MKLFISLLLIAVIGLFMACGGNGHEESQVEGEQEMEMQEGEAHMEEEGMADNMAEDPVCGMKVNKDETQYTAEYEGETYYFCMEADKVAFLENPEKYVSEQDNN